MSILQFRDPNTGKFMPIPALVGPQGPQGPIPVKGVDYFTDEDKEEMVQYLMNVIKTPVFGRVDAENNIILSGDLAEGTYILKYEDSKGNLTVIGTLNSSGESEPVVTNWLKLSTEIDGVTPYNGGKGYKEDIRFSASSNAEKDAPGVYVTGLISVNGGDIVRLKNISLNTNNADQYTKNLCYFNVLPTTTNIGGTLTVGVHDGTGWDLVFDENGNLIQFTVKSGIEYIMLHGSYIGDDSIITINEEIPGISQDESGPIAIEWAGGVKLDKNTGAEDSGANYGASQSIPYDSDYQYTLATSNSYLVQAAICWYAADGSFLGWNDALSAGSDGEAETNVLVPLDNAASFRIRAYTIYSSDDALRTKALNTVSLRKDMIGGVSYTNQIPISTDEDGNILNGVGYVEGYRINSSGALVAASGISTTGYIPCKNGDILRGSAGIIGDNTGWTGIVLYDENKTWIASIKQEVLANSSKWIVNDNSSFYLDTTAVPISEHGDFSYIRFHSQHISDNGMIITVNEEIR